MVVKGIISLIMIQQNLYDELPIPKIIIKSADHAFLLWIPYNQHEIRPIFSLRICIKYIYYYGKNISVLAWLASYWMYIVFISLKPLNFVRN